ncbi:ABC-F family ATP-binding cassette domain-containing protein [Caproiciproducens sp. AGMB10547]|uniref:ABC-F family ATP-binding cassette domain-containing protein n=1 Tax=Caproiciproducens faecalis TaxID=2820301 RepID=A0ABS7DJA2_9FIRM|nr:ABC-F family ATP-binding cassette domain-containing protein [Caproiciproducens faecalis]
MLLLSAEKIRKSYSEKILLKDVSLGIQEGDKIGIIGVNGTGKSTLLKIIAGQESPDSGTVSKFGGVRVGYLPQNPVFPDGITVLEQVRQGIAQQQRESKEFECKAILTRLGITDFDAPVSRLSGGQKKRVSLASALVTTVDVLVLDEPTNHMDNDMVDWLENYLARYNGAMIMVTHDRYFLDRVTNRIVELQDGNLYNYQANYTKYLELKAEREGMEAASERKRQSLLKKELEWIQRGARARSTKQRFRVERFEQLSAQEVKSEQEKLTMSSVSSRLGRKIIEIDGIEKHYGDRQLIKGFSYNLLRGDRIGIIGANGCGKSTLLKIITGQVLPDNGTVTVGETVRVGFFSQECEEMDTGLRAIDYIKNISAEIMTPEGMLTASQLMEKFLFGANLQYSVIGRLSGGERRRLYLLGVLMQAPNVLLFDEPTNDLDIQTLTILEDYLQNFSGAVVVVSHDRYFLDKVAEHIFAFEGGEIRDYTGGYSDYLAVRKPEPEEPAKTKESKPKPAYREKPTKLRFSFMEQREYGEIDAVIAELEERIAAKEREMAEQASNYVKLPELIAEKEALQAELDAKTERWVYLNDLADRIAEQNGEESP